MIRKLLPLILGVLALAGGAFFGELLRERVHPEPPAPADALPGDDAPRQAHASAGDSRKDSPGTAFFRFPNQFFVPVMRGDRVEFVMVLSLSVAMAEQDRETVHGMEHRLRDGFLRAMLIHANTGGFDGNFTLEPRLRRLRDALMATAREVTDGVVRDVLIEDLARQDQV